MDSDDFIAEALSSGRYAVDLKRGLVLGRRGRPLAASPDRDGYRGVTLVLSSGQRSVRSHRVVAAALWGIDAIRGRQVGHWNGDPADNRPENLWLPTSQAEHYAHDDAIAPKYRGGAPPKASWEPCVRCGDPDGPPYYGRVTPARVSGAKFEIEGDLCWRCYRALDERERRRRKREGTDVPPTVGEPRGSGGQEHRDKELEALG